MYANNTSGFKGVSFYEPTNSWSAHIRINKKLIHLGYFKAPEMAHAAYCAAAKIYHGEFARTE